MRPGGPGREGVAVRVDGAREREFTIANGDEPTGGRREDVFTSTALTSRLEARAAAVKNADENRRKLAGKLGWLGVVATSTGVDFVIYTRRGGRGLAVRAGL